MADYLMAHPVWPDVTRTATGAEERDRYQEQGWRLADDKPVRKATPTRVKTPDEPAPQVAATTEETSN